MKLMKKIYGSYLVFFSVLMLLVVFNQGCDEGQVQDPNEGDYSVNIIFSPAINLNTSSTSTSGSQAKSSTGSAEVNRTSDVFTIFIKSDILNIGFSGEIIADDLNTTVVDQNGDTVTINITFGDKRTDFAGTISFASGSYALVARKYGT